MNRKLIVGSAWLFAWMFHAWFFNWGIGDPPLRGVSIIDSNLQTDPAYPPLVCFLLGGILPIALVVAGILIWPKHANLRTTPGKTGQAPAADLRNR